VNERVLALLALVRDKQGMSRGEVQRALQVGDRQIRRYVDQAADCGYLETKGTGPGQILTVIEIPTPPIPILPAPEKIF
jgi:predicted DNA-binding transcriptional regulator YafY